MPLGASITYGQASSTGNGYREQLRTQLRKEFGNPVNMVGSRKGGKMADNDVEGWPGMRIEQVHDKAKESVPRDKPNVVLINAGTNDAVQNFKVNEAGARMEALIRDVYKWSPRATVVLSTLLMNKKDDVDKRVQDINNQFRAVARKLGQEKKRIVLVDMHGKNGPTEKDMADDTHPNDAGYKKVADIWLKGIRWAGYAGLIQDPEKVQGLPDNGPDN
ncbi:carbohydrate esterase family 3 protein [Canariomyces notabilis]|uniref:Carbohydrate esterase family 3 protein n=1 Tax=Canariomyces notabilis TaxID=2074819 RepID=A0AAN6T9K1_9PEZI|nr:carbohydrate esterase family 3 protein [Canariomyces arenarius]